jgi:hypothetical protein
MEISNEHDDRILRFIGGRLGPDEQREFEAELRNNPALEEEVKELSLLKVGVFTWDHINQGHIDSETLVTYAEDPNKLDSSEVEKIKSHLKICSDCREELKLTDQTFKLMNYERAIPPEPISIFRKIREFLFLPRLSPAYGMIILLLLIVPMVIFVPHLAQQGGETQICSIKPGVRDLGTENNIILNRDKRIVKIEFTLPIIDDATYDFELYDSGRRKLLTRHNNPAEIPFAFVIPTVYLQEGRYTLRVVEYENSKKLGSSELEFNISFAE